MQNRQRNRTTKRKKGKWMTSRSTKERWKQRGGWWERGHVLDKGWYESAIGNSGRKVVVAVVVQ